MDRRLPPNDGSNPFTQCYESLNHVLATCQGNRITGINSAGERLFGTPRDDLIGRKITDFFADEYAALSDNEFDLLADESEGIPLKLNTSRGEVVDAKLWVHRLPSEGRPRPDFMVEVHDISGHMWVAKTLREREQKLNQIIVTVADGIVTIDEHRVITTFNPAAEQMFGAVGKRKPEYVQYAADIHGSGTHLLRLINDILDLSKVEAGAQDLFEEDVDLTEIVRESMEMVRERASHAGVSIVADLPSGFPRVLADRVRLKQIMLNLLTNAIKFTDQVGKVDITLERADREAQLRVSDNGVGIAPEDMETVLKPFGQVTDMMTRGREGTSLGLPLCKSLMELHGGRLELDRGTRVTLVFPPGRVLADSL